MRRIRLVFLGLAIGLAIPMIWLVRGAFESVQYEQEIEHRTVAERLFDEMERPLAQFAANEDARPAAEYRFYRGTHAGDGGRSPLSHPPEASYVVGYFELDADGAFHSPLVPRDESQARIRGEWPPTATVRQTVARVEAIARRGLGAKRETLSELDWLVEQRQAPGTTTKTVSPEPTEPKAAAFDDEVKERLRKSDTYQVLSKLNRASQQRSARTRDEAERATVARKEAPVLGKARSNGSAAQFYRKAKPSDRKDAHVAEVATRETIAGPQAASEPQLSDFDAAESFAAPEARPQVVAEVEGLRGAGRLEARSLAPPRVPAAAPAPPDLAFEAAEEVSRAALAVPGDDARRRDAAIAAPSEESAPADAERVIEVDPLHGELVDDAYLVLSRSVRVGAAARRQGVVIDVARLAAGVGDPVLLDSGLESRARLQFLSANRASSLSRGGGFVYRHRFAVPFDSLAASMTLPRLSDAEGPNYLYILSLLLLLAGAVGLVAVYRMVAVTVTFAERRNDFVAAVSHELKTPLTSIRMYGEMLRDGMVGSEAKQHEYYATITAETERLTRLIDNVLEFSKLEQGTRDVNLVVGALGPVVEEAARLLEPHVREMGFELRVEVESAVPAVRFDRDALLQVVFNLVDNAVKYARDAEEKVITLQCRASEGGVELAVRDRGPGVSARHLSKIFEPFYRGERELTRTAKGTGIGLALVRGLAERMDAAVSGNNLSEGGFEVALSFRTATT